MRAHGDLGGRVLLPVHWATFNLAFHRWAEPVQRLIAAAARSRGEVVVPLPGERIDVLDPAAAHRLVDGGRLGGGPRPPERRRRGQRRPGAHPLPSCWPCSPTDLRIRPAIEAQLFLKSFRRVAWTDHANP